ncbi:unnamed protein product [Protopolystoma xenopodis]|uniref:Uncharacterized protein n=1 Tax=Protopolystoma xenopodis TaxID=117903 RepID=A0A3S5BSA0_9PLAT|nr:unnamed protein product [Protopolystoma xenopodis]
MQQLSWPSRTSDMPIGVGVGLCLLLTFIPFSPYPSNPAPSPSLALSVLPSCSLFASTLAPFSSRLWNLLLAASPSATCTPGFGQDVGRQSAKSD